MSERYTIQTEDGLFWTGFAWSDEAPDAVEFDDDEAAIRAAEEAAEAGQHLQDLAVIRDHGYATERAVAVIRA